MIDPFTSLAFSVYSNKGAFALLLGSGISRASGIPTGWEVVLDLIRKVAAVEGADCEPDPAAWFRSERGGEPDYSKLLDAVAPTPTERQQLLSAYFEPTEDERQQGLKLPSAAHRSIARLAAGGSIRVIITTNFDRLVERALEEVGITPVVISNSDQIAGALPLVHSGTTVIKIHGDYLDTRIRNTYQELNEYDEPLNRLLDRVFDEFGMIISGWSGDWDVALRAAIERCPTRRFATYWATRSPLSGMAESLGIRRSALMVKCKDADQFFGAVEEKVAALESLARPHPLSAKLAAATVKRYIVDPAARIRLHDLVREETEKLLNELNGSCFEASTRLEAPEELLRRIEKYRALADVLLSIVVTGCYWGGGPNSIQCASILERIADSRGQHGGYEYLIRLRHYPTLLLLYSAGIAAVASSNFTLLATVLTKARTRSDSGEIKELCLVVHAFAVMSNDVGRMLPGLESRYTPTSDHLHAVLRSLFLEYLPREEDYDEAFNRFEYYLGLVNSNLSAIEWQNGGLWGPVGRFGWKGRDLMPEKRIQAKVEREIEALGENWPLVKAGLFQGSIDRARQAKHNFDLFLSTLRWF